MKKIFILFTILLIVALTGCSVQTPPPNNQFLKNNDTLTFNGTLSINNINITEDLYEDLRFPVNQIPIRGLSNVPEETKFGDAFSPSSNEELFLIAQMPHSYKEGTDIFPHWHWIVTNSDSGDVVWCIEYTWANINDEFDFVSGDYCVVDSTTNASNIHLMTPHLVLNGTNKTASSIINARLYRNATDPRDTYTSDAYLLEFDIHYKIGRLGEAFT